MDMTKSYKKDIQLLMTILKNQDKIIEALKHFNCNQNNLEKNDMAFDLCAFYMAQIGEASKMLTDDTKGALNCLNADILKSFRNIIDHTYEKINKAYLKAYIFSMISPAVTEELKNRIKYCMNNAK